MLWIYIAVIVGVMVIIGGTVHEFMSRGGEPLEWFLGSFLSSMLAGALFCLLTNGIGYAIVGHHDAKIGESGLVSLQDNTERRGSFFLGSGTISDEPVFFYYEERNGAYHLEHIRADRASVVETEDDPRVEFYRETSDNALLGLPVFKPSTTAVFYVPNGSVVSNFELDAQ